MILKTPRRVMLAINKLDIDGTGEDGNVSNVFGRTVLGVLMPKDVQWLCVEYSTFEQARCIASWLGRFRAISSVKPTFV